MMRRFLFLGLTAVPWAFAACSNNVSFVGSGSAVTGTASGPGTGTSTGTNTGASTGTSTGSGGGAGDCASDADCMGGTCAPITPGGYKICLRMPPEATKCHMIGGPPEECCSTKDCKPPAACYDATTMPYCGGPALAPYNRCVADTCQDDAGCIHNNLEPWICIPAGAFGYPVRQCIVGYCHTSAECNAKPGGVCRPIANPCCNLPLGLACVYPGGCAKQSDCGNDSYCAIDSVTKSGTCRPGGIGCPG